MDSLPQLFSDAQISTPAPMPKGRSRRRAREERHRRFVRLASHELRTPLNAIIGFAEIISTELYGPIGDERYRSHAALIHESGLKLMHLVSQVVEIARLEAGTMELAARPERVSEAFAATLRAVDVEARTAGVRIEAAIAPGAQVVCADARAVVVILTHLVQNALKVAPTGGVVRLTAASDGAFVGLSVVDDGPGVREDEIERLLRPFEQGEDALVRHGGGAGLGLAHSRLLCAAMGGALELSSPPGEGLTAQVRLPSAPALAAYVRVEPVRARA